MLYRVKTWLAHLSLARKQSGGREAVDTLLAASRSVVEEGSAGVGARAVPAAQPVQFSPAFNRAELMDRLGGDTDLLADVVRIFIDDCPSRLAAIKNAVGLRDAELIRTTSHALKGAAGTLSATALFEAAETLERLGTEGRLDSTEAAWRTVAKEASNLMDIFRRMDPAGTTEHIQCAL